MTAQRQWTVGIGVVMALVFGTALVIKIRPQIDLLGVGSTAPTFHATDLRTGRPTTLGDYRGKVVLLNVWATWCEPCRVEMPSMERIYRRLGEGGDFRIRSEEHTSELQSPCNLVCRLLLEKKKN